jgi:hypothetical protein
MTTGIVLLLLIVLVLLLAMGGLDRKDFTVCPSCGQQTYRANLLASECVNPDCRGEDDQC